MRLTTVVMFGAGYVMGTKAGRERYEQIVTVAENASKRLDQFSARTQADARSAAVSPAQIKAPVADYASVRKTSTHPTGPPGRIGARLASAEQSVDEGASTLAATFRARLPR